MEVSKTVWYNGSVKQAIEQVKSVKTLLLVFVQGEDELSKKYSAFLENGIPLEPMSYIALKIHKNSRIYQQFRQIYTIVPVPSIFLIGSNGKPLSVICSNGLQNLIPELKEAVEKQKLIRDTSRDTVEEVRPRKARIQFRLPSDEVRSWDFPSGSTLHDVKLFLMENALLGTNFKLLRVYPRTAFEPEDDAKTLEALSLTPNATLIVVPVQGIIQTTVKNLIARSNLLFMYFATLLNPLVSVINYVKRFLPKSGQKPSKVHRRKWKKRSSKDRKRSGYKSNIHSLPFDDDDSDSEMNMYNGNSTQQM